MAELLFFMTDGDSGEFADYVFGQFDARFAMDESPTADIISVTRKDTFLSAIERSHFGARFSVLSDRWQKYPLAVSETITNDGRRFFCADQRHGGPAFDFIVRRHIKDEHTDHLVFGSFSHFPWYICDTAYLKDHSEYRTFPRPPEMKDAWAAVQKYLRSNGTRTICRETQKAGPWALPGALDAFNHGTWLRMGDWHFDPRASR